jgi:protein-disulfide isomerase
MKTKLDSIVAVTLVVCALAMTCVVLHREFLASSPTNAKTEAKPGYIKEWRAYFAKGIHIGWTEAPVQLQEFADFECPYCGSFHTVLKVVRARYPNQVALSYVDFPLPGHRFAMPAARVAECAGDQGRFEAIYDQLFEGQDQFGLRAWDDYATAAGVPDMAAFDACIKKTDPIPRVEEGRVLGAKLDVRGTPTIIINGWKLPRPPTAEELDQMVQRIIADKSPVDGKF